LGVVVQSAVRPVKPVVGRSEEAGCHSPPPYRSKLPLLPRFTVANAWPVSIMKSRVTQPGPPGAQIAGSWLPFTVVPGRGATR
jgi:hypothetical protein